MREREVKRSGVRERVKEGGGCRVEQAAHDIAKA